MNMQSITKSWDLYEQELRRYLNSKLPNPQCADDVLHDVFIKAMRNDEHFSSLENPRAWLYKVTKNSVADYYRSYKAVNAVDNEVTINNELDLSPVLHLSHCLPFALKALSNQDREVIERCNLGNLSQMDYAKLHNLSLSGAKSRLQRAKKRLKDALQTRCKVRYDEQGKVCCFENDCQ